MSRTTNNPAVLLDSLHGIRRKVRTLTFFFGLGLVVAAAVGLLLATVLLDYLLNLPLIPRVLFMAASLAGVLYVLVNYLIRPLISRLSINDVAGRLEQAFPQFDDRLRSTVDFVSGDIPGSEAMKKRVVDQAGALAENVKLSNALVHKPVIYSMAAGVGAILLAVMLAIVSGDYARIAMERLLLVNAPSWPKRV
jgi:hypothetical protein